MLAVGAEAPDFSLKDQNSQPVRLSAFRGEKTVLLVFFPLAFTAVCQGELDEIRDHPADYQNDQTATVAISVGPSPTHKVWATQRGYGFPLLSDFWPHGAVARSYGVFHEERGCALRGSFLVDASGVVRWRVVNGLGEPRDVAAYSAAVAGL